MNQLKNYNPMKFLDEYRGKLFQGEWPTLPQMFTINCTRFPERPCFTDFEGPGGSRNTLTYTQVNKKIQTLAAWLSANGVNHGDKVAVTGKNSPQWAIVWFAALFAGATICPIDYALHTDEQENLLATAKPKFLFVDEEKYTYYSSKDNAFGVYSLSPKYQETYVYNLETKSQPKIDPATIDDTAAILFTSGTTGVPKGVMLSHRNLVSDAYIAQCNMIITYQDVFYALLPLHHAYTMQAVMIETIAVGAECVFGKSMAVSRLMKELKEGGITMLLGVPLLFNKLRDGIVKGLKAKGAFVYGLMRCLMGLSYFIKKVFGVNPGKHMFSMVLKQANIYTIRIAICGGGPLTKQTFKFFNAMGINFVQGYGLTETSPIIALNPIEHFKIQSVGSYFKGHMEMKILEPNADGIGEIAVKGPMVMQGYYQMPEETAKMFTPDGFLKTGDLGWLDKENYLMLSGRVKNMIVTSGGKNVYPEEIEDSFQLETDISQITVQGFVGKEDDGEELEALIYPSDEMLTRLNLKRESLGAQEKETIRAQIQAIVDKINKKLQPYQRIARFTLLEKPLEMTTTLKVKRNYKK